jgi:hypothetical protein
VVPQITYEDVLKEPQVVTAGQKCVIDCGISGNPVPKSVWTMGDQTLETNNALYLEINSTYARITMLAIDRSQAGVYKLTATNEVGEASAEFNYTVIGKQFLLYVFFYNFIACFSVNL